MPRLSKAIQSHERVMAKDALDDIARKRAQAKASNTKYTDPAAMQGFKRDEWEKSLDASNSLYTEIGQKNFLEVKNKDNPQEMPDDLIKFLNDAGPLKRAVDKDFTSPKVFDSLKKDDDIILQKEQQERQRRRRVMPMMSEREGTLDADEDRMDGTTVSRTTNFSTAVRDDDKAEIRLSDEELFKLLSDLQDGNVTPDELVEKTFKDNQVITKEQRMENIKLVENMKEYTAVPTLMQDTDKSYVGAWSESINDLKLAGLRIAPKNVMLSFEYDPSISLNEELRRNLDEKNNDGTDGQSNESRREKSMSTQEFLRQARTSSEIKEI